MEIHNSNEKSPDGYEGAILLVEETITNHQKPQNITSTFVDHSEEKRKKTTDSGLSIIYGV